MTDPNFHITTQRLYLSYFQPSNPAHCDFLVTLYNTPEFIASIGGKPTSVTTRDAARALLEGRFRAEHARNGYGTYLVSLKSSASEAPTASHPDDGEEIPFAERLSRCKPIGTVSLMRGEPPNAYTAPDLGFAILPEEMRKGYAREAAEGLLKYAEEELGVRDVLGLFDPTNAASRGVFRSLGFRDRGVRKLKVFGNIEGAVWVREGMAEDLGVYGF
ncbi:including n-acetylases of ribosomal protein [Macrophomina phaseolina]|uniref:Including n-acetylases of ribosomal protein n=1 Tax=Macrophomina phaseolina TaxID=35725 RepID=A0ABQ8GUD6_9PEZI|nr:including n-acetylases of ribosomal protein [Macrophomina phaseolina]